MITTICPNGTESETPTVIKVRTSDFIIVIDDLIDLAPSMNSICCGGCTNIGPLNPTVNGTESTFAWNGRMIWKVKIRIGTFKSKSLLYQSGNYLYNIRDTCSGGGDCNNWELENPVTFIQDSSGNYYGFSGKNIKIKADLNNLIIENSIQTGLVIRSKVANNNIAVKPLKM